MASPCKGFRRPRALGCSVQTVARSLLRAQGLLNLVVLIGRDRVTIARVASSKGNVIFVSIYTQGDMNSNIANMKSTDVLNPRRN